MKSITTTKKLLVVFSLFFIFSSCLQAGTFQVCTKSFVDEKVSPIAKRATLAVRINGNLESDQDFDKNGTGPCRSYNFADGSNPPTVSIHETLPGMEDVPGFTWIKVFDQPVADKTTIYVCQGGNNNNDKELYYHWGAATTQQTEWNGWDNIQCGNSSPRQIIKAPYRRPVIL